MRPGSGTVVVHFSMVKLPEKPMMPRLADARVGYFTTSTMDYSRPEHSAETRAVRGALAAGEERSQRALSRAGEAYRLLHRSGDSQKWVP